MFGFGKKKDKLTYKVEPPFDEIPSGWFVRNLHQDPKNRFWSCRLVHEDCLEPEADWVRYVEVSDYETASEAVQAAINAINYGGVKRKSLNIDTCA